MEEEYLKSTLKLLRKEIEKADLKKEVQARKIYSLQKYIWSELNISEYDREFNDKTIDNLSKQEELDFRNYVTENMIKKINNYRLMLNKPYFGMIEFNKQKIYIGLSSLICGEDIFVYDWRAPISSMFYNYTLNEAEYKACNNIIKGIITKKRQYEIEKGKLINYFDTDINIEDEYLKKILANTNTEYMGNIVSTIQKEQNLAIRNTTNKHLVIEGVAGSGKTSVAMHRIAYLLYQNKHISSDNILLLSPNSVFSKYISNVLPELGENNVLETTFDSLAHSYLKKYTSIENYYSYLNRVYKKENETIKYKFSNQILDDLDIYLVKYKEKLQFNKDIVIASKIMSKQLLNELIQKYNSLCINDIIMQINKDVRDFFSISKKHIIKVNKVILECININTNVDYIYSHFLIDYKKINYINTSFLRYEDIIPNLYIYFYLNDYPFDKKIEHVIIDEAQDYPLIFYKLLKRIFKFSSFTIVGDSKQSLNPYYSYNSLEEIKNLFDKSIYLKLIKTYRSSKNIMEFANKIIDVNMEYMRDSGNEIIQKNGNEKGIINDIKKHKNIAIITKNIPEAQSLYNSIKDKVDVSLVSEKNYKINGPIIIPIFLAKGLEFETVVIYSKDKIESKNIYYVAITRAQNNLIIYNQKH